MCTALPPLTPPVLRNMWPMSTALIFTCRKPPLHLPAFSSLAKFLRCGSSGTEWETGTCHYYQVTATLLTVQLLDAVSIQTEMQLKEVRLVIQHTSMNSWKHWNLVLTCCKHHSNSGRKGPKEVTQPTLLLRAGSPLLPWAQVTFDFV